MCMWRVGSCGMLFMLLLIAVGHPMENLLEEDCGSEFAIAIRYQILTASSEWLSVSFYKAQARGYEVNLSINPTHSRCHISLVKVSGKVVEVLGMGYLNAQSGDESQNELIVRCLYGKIKVIHNKRLIFVCYDDEFKSGRAVFRATNGIKILEARYQPTEAILFTDDFMRGSEDVQHWERLSGTWIPVGADSSKFNPRLSANPFSVQTISTSNAIALAGYWFWDSYTFKVAVRPRSDSGSVGLIVYARDATNYLLFRWESASENGRQQIIAVEDGRRRVLAERDGGFVPMQWYQVEVHAFDDKITAFIDGRRSLSAKCDAFGMGKIGLYADGKMIAQFDDVCVESLEWFADTFDKPLLGRWKAIGGEWKVVSNALTVIGQKGAAPRTSWLVTGSDAWKDYEVIATFKAYADIVGIGACFKDVKNTYLLRIAPPRRGSGYSGNCQIVRILNGVMTVLAETPCSITPGQWHNLSFKVSEGLLCASVDGKELLKAFDDAFTSGKVALFHEGNSSAAFSGINVRFGIQQRFVTPTVAPQFTHESTMVDWASPMGAWRQAGGMFWHRGSFFGISSLKYYLQSEKQFRDALFMILCGDGQDPNSGYKLSIDGSSEDLIAIELMRSGKSVTKSSIRREREEATSVEFSRDGALLLVKYDGKPLIKFVDPNPLEGHKVGVAPAKGVIDFGRLQATSNHMLDYTFSNAPVDWWSARGSWEVTERWTCSPEWSFFGSKDSRMPLLVSKRSFGGDITVEAYVSIRMHEGGYNYPGDLNISLCVDGVNLDSAYNFVFAGWNNSRSCILKGAKVMAERSDEMGRLTKPMQQYHRYWWYLRAEKCGGTLRMFIDDVLILEAKDDKPTEGGRVAIWTVNKGISVARVRIWYEREMQSKPLDEFALPIQKALKDTERLISELSGKRTQFQVPIKFDFETAILPIAVRQGEDNQVAVVIDTTTSLSGRRSLKLINAMPGGKFEVTLLNAEFDAVKAPIMRFAYKLQPDVKVDMIVRALGQVFFINFAGNMVKEGDPRLLGSIPNVTADGNWHMCQFNIADALASKVGRRDSLIVHSISFANLSNDIYSLAGMNGNRFGTLLNIDDFALLQPTQHAAR